MCTLHLFYRTFPEAPVLLAANRDENLDRAWSAPDVLVRRPFIFGPRDRTAGGTWLGVNEAGLVVALANHEGTLSRGNGMCSRGAVVLETLRHESAEQARTFAEWVAPACKTYTLLIADPERAYVVDHGTDGTLTYRLLPGCHVVTNARFRAPRDAKAGRCLDRMEELAGAPAAPPPARLFAFLSDHRAAAGTTALCVHPQGESRFGTSSASVVRVGPSGRVEGFHFAPGPPCCTPPVDVTPAFAAAAATARGP